MRIPHVINERVPGVISLEDKPRLSLAQPIGAVVKAALIADFHHMGTVVFGHPAIHVIKERGMIPEGLGAEQSHYKSLPDPGV